MKIRNLILEYEDGSTKKLGEEFEDLIREIEKRNNIIRGSMALIEDKKI